MLRALLVLILLLCPNLTWAEAPGSTTHNYRWWTPAESGKRIRAEMIDYRDGKVTLLNESGDVVRVELDSLHERDKRWVEEHREGSQSKNGDRQSGKKKDKSEPRPIMELFEAIVDEATPISELDTTAQKDQALQKVLEKINADFGQDRMIVEFPIKDIKAQQDKYRIYLNTPLSLPRPSQSVSWRSEVDMKLSQAQIDNAAPGDTLKVSGQPIVTTKQLGSRLVSFFLPLGGTYNVPFRVYLSKPETELVHQKGN